MSAELLRKAAEAIRDTGIALPVLADWMDATADSVEEAEDVSALYHMRDPGCDCISHREVRAAFATARAYLGDDA